MVMSSIALHKAQCSNSEGVSWLKVGLRSVTRRVLW